MARTPQYTNEQMIAALAAKKGLVYHAAKVLGCRPGTIYERAQRSQEVAQAIRDQRGEIVDNAEMKLFKAVDRGEPWAVGMVLKTLGKDRGYVERSEVGLNTSIQVEVVEVVVGSRQEAQALLAALPQPNGVPRGG